MEIRGTVVGDAVPTRGIRRRPALAVFRFAVPGLFLLGIVLILLDPQGALDAVAYAGGSILWMIFLMFLPIFLLLAIFVFMFSGHSGMGALSQQAAKGVVGVGRIAASGMAKGVGRAATYTGQSGGSSLWSGPADVDVLIFRVTDLLNQQYDCELVGRVAVFHLRRGDDVRVRARRTRGGRFMARRLEITSTGSVIVARPTLELVLEYAARVVLVLLALGVASLVI